MKKFSVLIALALLAVAGTGYAVTCTYDNVPARHAARSVLARFAERRHGRAHPGSGGVDTLVSIVNVSTPGVIAHVTVWNKYSKAVLDFNVPLTGKDVVSFSMSDIMNGKLNVEPERPEVRHGHGRPCGVNLTASPATYLPTVGFGARRSSSASRTLRSGRHELGRVHVDLVLRDGRLRRVPQQGVGLARRVRRHLDVHEPRAAQHSRHRQPGLRLGGGSGDGTFKPDLSGYLTIDVVNFCTNYFPGRPAVLQRGRDRDGRLGADLHAERPHRRRVLRRRRHERAATSRGDPAVPVEFDNRLTFGSTAKTFFGKFVPAAVHGAARLRPRCWLRHAASRLFQFGGDGREPLGDRYGFRYLADGANGLQSWILVWRSDIISTARRREPSTSARGPDPTGTPATRARASMTPTTSSSATVYDNDENFFRSPDRAARRATRTRLRPTCTCSSSRSGSTCSRRRLNRWVVQGRLDRRDALRSPHTGATPATGRYNQAWVGVQHTAPGAFLSVGHAASEPEQPVPVPPRSRSATGTSP